MASSVGGQAVVDGGWEQYGWVGLVATAAIGVITLMRAAWDTLSNLLGLRDRVLVRLEEKEHEIKKQMDEMVSDMKEHVGAVHDVLQARIGNLETRTSQNYELITTMRIDIASKMVTREELRDLERSLKEHLDTALKQLIISLKDKD